MPASIHFRMGQNEMSFPTIQLPRERAAAAVAAHQYFITLIKLAMPLETESQYLYDRLHNCGVLQQRFSSTFGH